MIATVNGVQLVKVSATNFRASASGPQVSLGADGMVPVVASSASTGRSRALDLPCAPLISMASTPAGGSSLTGASTVVLDWSASPDQIPQNTAAGIAFMGWVYSQPTAQLDSYDLATNKPAGVIDQPYMFQDAVGATLTLRTQTLRSGYIAAVTYPGAMAAVPDLSTFGYCGRSARITFTK